MPTPAGCLLAGLAAIVGGRLVAGADPGSVDTLRVTGVGLDSRRVRPGELYAALPGQRVHGAQFVEQAASAGAVAVLTDPEGAARAAVAGLPALVVADPRAQLGALAAAIYGRPAEGLLMLGVTGTNGKTTTSFLLDAVLAGAGRRTGLIGTVQTRVAGDVLPSERTTPEAPDLQRMLADMLAAGVQACTMEVSSHALALHRVDGIVFDVVGFTNLSQDHLDFHGNLAAYFAAKAQLFSPAKARRGVVLLADRWARRLVEQAPIPLDVVSMPEGEADVPARSATRVPGVDPPSPERPGDAAQPVADRRLWQVTDVVPRGARVDFRLIGPQPPSPGVSVESGSSAMLDLPLSSPLPGSFNVANAALAAVMALLGGVPPDQVHDGLAGAVAVPGRMETVRPAAGRAAGRPGAGTPTCVVDYAHTPDAVAGALRALRAGTPGRLVIVLGAGGERDRLKREPMGEAAAGGADVVVVTDDNPRSEDPAAIRAAVLAGARRRPGGALVLEVPDRREAIRVALAHVSRAGDTLLVAGKGHETGQEVAGAVLAFDDRQVLLEELTGGPGAHEEPAGGDE